MNVMQFEYSNYYYWQYKYPIHYLILVVVFFTVGMVGTIILYKNENYRKKHNLNMTLEMIKLILCCFVFGFILATFIIPLARGGIYFRDEKESDAVQIIGQIEDTYELDQVGGGKYGYEDYYGYGSVVVIDGTKYYLVTYGDYKPGDLVYIRVLPKSKFILEMGPAGLAPY